MLHKQIYLQYSLFAIRTWSTSSTNHIVFAFLIIAVLLSIFLVSFEAIMYTVPTITVITFVRKSTVGLTAPAFVEFPTFPGLFIFVLMICKSEIFKIISTIPLW